MITGLSIPFVGYEARTATEVKPDFAIVVAQLSADDPEDTRPKGTWLIMGDAKDYERVRSRIDDQRMLKGFLQVAVGAVSAEAWSQVPKGMRVHEWGALAVPRNAFLQPMAVVDHLRDHRDEVLARIRERDGLLADLEEAPIAPDELQAFVEHLEFTFDPASCGSCALHDYCRSEIRARPEPEWRLVEIGIPVEQRAGLIGLLDGTGDGSAAPMSRVAQVVATRDGAAVISGARRTDPIGLPGTVNVVLAKSDAAALGVHGLGIQVVTHEGRGRWRHTEFTEPQSPVTRLRIMEALGKALEEAMADRASHSGPDIVDPVHLILPDGVTGDVLVSIADSLAGVEISRLRWERDLEMGRKALTFDGEPASIPTPLTDRQRLVISFLLDADRNRSLTLRTAVVDTRSMLSQLMVAGGPAVESLRLDYLVVWGATEEPVDHRAVSDEVAALAETPGARLSNERSDAIHRASVRGHRPDPIEYQRLVQEELRYKAAVLERAIDLLATFEVSRLREVHRVLEADAQAVWRRRWALHASDLVRFGRVSWWWRNDQVDQIDADTTCATQLAALGNPHVAKDMARDAGTRTVASAEVVQSVPLRLRVRSRRLIDGSNVVLAHSGYGPSVELERASLRVQVTSFKFHGQYTGRLETDDQSPVDGCLRFERGDSLALSEGSEVILLDGDWVQTFRNGTDVAVKRPGLDTTNAPKPHCVADSYDLDPDLHRNCCRSHESREAETSDWIAEQHALGKRNPQVWPPLIDEDAFDTPAVGAPTDAGVVAGARVPNHLTIDDLD